MKEYKGMKIGDLVTGYWSGYYELMEIKPNDQKFEEPLFVVKPRYTHNGKPVKNGKLKECSAFYCKSAKQHIESLLQELTAGIQRLECIYDSLT